MSPRDGADSCRDRVESTTRNLDSPSSLFPIVRFSAARFSEIDCRLSLAMLRSRIVTGSRRFFQSPSMESQCE